MSSLHQPSNQVQRADTPWPKPLVYGQGRYAIVRLPISLDRGGLSRQGSWPPPRSASSAPVVATDPRSTRGVRHARSPRLPERPALLTLAAVRIGGVLPGRERQATRGRTSMFRPGSPPSSTYSPSAVQNRAIALATTSSEAPASACDASRRAATSTGRGDAVPPPFGVSAQPGRWSASGRTSRSAPRPTRGSCPGSSGPEGHPPSSRRHPAGDETRPGARPDRSRRTRADQRGSRARARRTAHVGAQDSNLVEEASHETPSAEAGFAASGDSTATTLMTTNVTSSA